MEQLENAIAEIKEAMPGLELRENEPMSEHCSFRIGGPARVLAIPSDVTSLSKICYLLKKYKLAPYIIGNGTNILFPDEGLSDLFIISTAKLGKLFMIGEDAIYAEAGVSLAKLAGFAQQNSLEGLEFASGIPGTLGGGVRMNAGAYGGEMKDIVQNVTVLTREGEILKLEKEELGFGYRASVIKDRGYVVLGAELMLVPGDKEEILARMQELKNKRVEKQPLEYPSAGSAFKRPEGYFAGKLVMDAGLSGYAVGGAKVSEKHCGFLINAGGATASDVMELIRQIQAKVKEQFGVQLEPEIQFLGEF